MDQQSFKVSFFNQFQLAVKTQNMHAKFGRFLSEDLKLGLSKIFFLHLKLY